MPAASGGYGLRGEDRLLGGVGQHRAHDLLDGENVDARSPTVEIMAGAVPLTGVETQVMRVVVAAERERQSVDRDPIQLARVAIRLLDLADQGTVHRRIPPLPRQGRSRGRHPVVHPTGEAVVAPPYTPTPRRVTP